jgi:UDP-N-acetylmuramoylalanine--D-glutamate ligase
MKDISKQTKVAFSDNQIARKRNDASVFEHSLEFVAKVNQVSYINDSKATSVNDTWNSLQAIEKCVVLILGGNDRRSDYSVLSGQIDEKVKAIVCLGSDRDQIFSALIRHGMIVHALDLKEAVSIAGALSKPGDTVLFSPGCPSFDAFDNYKNRGNKFKELVCSIS